MIVVTHWTEWLEDLRVERFAEATNAGAYVDSLANDRTAFVFNTDETDWMDAQWRHFSNTQLVHIFNALAPMAPVKKFENRDVALRRVGLKIIDRARDLEFTTFNPSPIISGDVNLTRGSVMPREVKMGEFKPVGRNTHLGKILGTYFAGTSNVDDIAAAMALTAEQVIRYLWGGRWGNGIAYSVGTETRKLSVTLPEGVDETSVFKATKDPRPAKGPRVPKIGEFKAVRRSSALGKIVEAALSGGTVAEVAGAAGVNEETLAASLKSLRRGHGIDSEIVDDTVTLKVPDGKDPFLPIATPKERVASNGASKSPIAENATITLLVTENPKRPTASAYVRFALYRTGQTVAEFLAAGGTKADLSWDRVHSFIKIEDVAGAAAA